MNRFYNALRRSFLAASVLSMLFLLMTLSVWLTPSHNQALAADPPGSSQQQGTVERKTGTGSAQDKFAAPVGVPMPLGRTTLPGLIGRVIRWFMGLVGVLAFVMFVYGGFLYMNAGGMATVGTGEHKETINKAKKMMTRAIMGLVIIFMSYAIVSFIINALTK